MFALSQILCTWNSAPGGERGLKRVLTRSVGPMLAIEDETGSLELRRLQQELVAARAAASDATNAESRLRNMVRIANQNAQRLSEERDAAEMEAKAAEERLEDLKEELEATRILADQEEAAMREQIQELQLRLEVSGSPPSGDAADLLLENTRLSEELKQMYLRAKRAENEVCGE